jgi:hypothetical protein
LVPGAQEAATGSVERRSVTCPREGNLQGARIRFGGTRMDVDAVLQSVHERDKWRHRLEVLLTSLADTRERRRKALSRLKRIRSDLKRVQDYSDALLDGAQASMTQSRMNAARNPSLPAR